MTDAGRLIALDGAAIRAAFKLMPTMQLHRYAAHGDGVIGRYAGALKRSEIVFLPHLV
jgi:hypothetical protein